MSASPVHAHTRRLSLVPNVPLSVCSTHSSAVSGQQMAALGKLLWTSLCLGFLICIRRVATMSTLIRCYETEVTQHRFLELCRAHSTCSWVLLVMTVMPILSLSYISAPGEKTPLDLTHYLFALTWKKGHHPGTWEKQGLVAKAERQTKAGVSQGNYFFNYFHIHKTARWIKKRMFSCWNWGAAGHRC